MGERRARTRLPVVIISGNFPQLDPIVDVFYVEPSTREVSVQLRGENRYSSRRQRRGRALAGAKPTQRERRLLGWNGQRVDILQANLQDADVVRPQLARVVDADS